MYHEERKAVLQSRLRSAMNFDGISFGLLNNMRCLTDEDVSVLLFSQKSDKNPPTQEKTGDLTAMNHDFSCML